MTEQEKFMKLAIRQAKLAYKADEVPVGAVMVLKGEVIARAHNTREKSKDATNHAEILCIKKACKKLGDFRLNDCELYVTLEPCMMCVGAILNARVGRVVYGASAAKPNQIGIAELVERAELNHKSELVGGVLKEECSKLLGQYFSSKRGLK